MEIKVERIIENDQTIKLERTGPREKRTLIYKLDKCVGCGLCTDLCPLEVIELGPVGAISREVVENTPKVTFQQEKCTLCGICTTCPFYAIDLIINDEPISEVDSYPTLKKEITINKDKIEFTEESKTIWKEIEEICPTEAFHFIEKNGEYDIEIEEEKCVYCGRCADKAPEDAIKVTKPFEGSIEVNQEKCEACEVCVKICPTSCISMPPREKAFQIGEKIKIEEEYCIFCGACEHNCPVNAIKIFRNSVNINKAQQNAPWTQKWEQVLESLKIGEG